MKLSLGFITQPGNKGKKKFNHETIETIVEIVDAELITDKELASSFLGHLCFR
jgi:hypothetical protein